MKRAFWLFLVACILISLAACGAEDPSTSVETHQITIDETAGQIDAAEPPVETTQPEVVDVEETVIYDNGGYKLTVKDLEDTGYSMDFAVLAENNTDRNIAFSCQDIVVNGITMYGDLYINVAAGKKANDEISFSYDDLKISGIEEIATVSVKECSIVDTDSYDTLETISFDFATTSSHVHQLDDSGHVLFEKDGIKIIHHGFSETLIGQAAIILIQNNTNQDILVQCHDAAVNGFMFTPLMSDTVYANTACYSEFEITDSTLEENDISEIEEVTLILNVNDNQTYHSLFSTEELTISFVGK